jgi:TATA-binding protein-associated factor
MLQKLLTAIIAEGWAHLYDSRSEFEPSHIPLVQASTLAQEITDKTLSWLQGKPPASYHEMAFALSRLHADCTALLQLFSTDCKLPMSSIPSLGTEIDLSGTIKGHFSIEVAQQAMGAMYSRLKDSLGRTRKKELALIAEKRNAILASIHRYNEVKSQHDIRISSGFAAAFVAFKSTPDKVSPIVKGIMNGIKVNIHYSVIRPLTRSVE